MLAQATQKWGRPWHSPRQLFPLISVAFNLIDYCMDTPLNLSSVWCLSENQSSSQAVYDNFSEALQCQVTKWHSARVCPSAELFNHRQPSALGQAAWSQIIKHPCVKDAINILYIISAMVNNDNYFTSCDPHHDIYTFCYWQIFWHSIWHIFWHSIWHSIWHIFWHSTWHIFWQMFWHIFWHMFWHIFWHSIWHSIWHIFWHIIWQIFWHSIWHSI